MKQRLTESPDQLKYRDIELNAMSANASTFCVLNKKALVYSYDVTHPMIFNTLKAADNAKQAIEYLKDDVDGEVYPKLTDADLEWYKNNWEGNSANVRRKLQAGRIWENVKIGKKKVTVISFWSKKSTSKEAVNLIKKAYKLKGDIVVEYMDSKIPEVFGKETQKTKEIKSKKHPELSEQEIISILIKSHTKGYSRLTEKEKEVVDEFRGTTADKVAMSTKKWGKTTPAEWNFYKTLGDSYSPDRSPSTRFLVELTKVIDNHLDKNS
jgi:hypothetical protein